MNDKSQLGFCDQVKMLIYVKDSLIPDNCQVASVTTEKGVNKISCANIQILDGSASEENFKVSSSDIFLPGNAITIKAGYGVDSELIFEGVITKQALKVQPEEGPYLNIECKDQAVKMTIGRKSVSFVETTDSDVISTLIGNYSDISADVTTTTVTLPILQQYYATDWDFMLTRAEVNSLLVTTLNNKVCVFSPTADTTSVLTISYGVNMYNFDAQMNSLTQFNQVKATAWDYKTQQLVSAEATNNLAGAGNISSDSLSQVVGLNDFQLQTSAALDSESLSNWAKGQILKSELSKITGEVKIQGSSKVEPGNYITIERMGERFNGDYFVSGVNHDISEGNWFTDVKFGLEANGFAQEPEAIHPPASGHLPGIHGLHCATVEKIFDDPESEFRIQINLPLFDQNGDGLWARLSNFYSTNGQGAFFIPEVGDEVIVGFLNDDPRYPIILGSMYSSKIKPFSTLETNEKNSIKAIITKSELQLQFDDENKVLTAITPAKNKLVLDDKNKQITIQDQDQNSIVMSSDGITIKSPKSINIEAEQQVSIKGKTGINIGSSGGDVTVSGNNIKQTADLQFSAQGNVTASVKGGGELTLRAPMVKIN
ncbi:type VI secretion system tip protein VgrG [uncultured Paraglaciecola sp.]|uniref:type VI secretion system tip protein VgrG n=1 Tax=uncultured Paraglaciecola sp. TaxID=1765024 RepID=UPI0025E3FB25|nr:type VI secretion system tip protein VgrG [uncultured Paraglaciecola sp.]